MKKFNSNTITVKNRFNIFDKNGISLKITVFFAISILVIIFIIFYIFLNMQKKDLELHRYTDKLILLQNIKNEYEKRVNTQYKQLLFFEKTTNLNLNQKIIKKRLNYFSKISKMNFFYILEARNSKERKIIIQSKYYKTINIDNNSLRIHRNNRLYDSNSNIFILKNKNELMASDKNLVITENISINGRNGVIGTFLKIDNKLISKNLNSKNYSFFDRDENIRDAIYLVDGSNKIILAYHKRNNRYILNKEIINDNILKFISYKHLKEHVLERDYRFNLDEKQKFQELENRKSGKYYILNYKLSDRFNWKILIKYKEVSLISYSLFLHIFAISIPIIAIFFIISFLLLRYTFDPIYTFIKNSKIFLNENNFFNLNENIKLYSKNRGLARAQSNRMVLSNFRLIETINSIKFAKTKTISKNFEIIKKIENLKIYANQLLENMKNFKNINKEEIVKLQFLLDTGNDMLKKFNVLDSKVHYIDRTNKRFNLFLKNTIENNINMFEKTNIVNKEAKNLNSLLNDIKDLNIQINTLVLNTSIKALHLNENNDELVSLCNDTQRLVQKNEKVLFVVNNIVNIVLQFINDIDEELFRDVDKLKNFSNEVEKLNIEINNVQSTTDKNVNLLAGHMQSEKISIDDLKLLINYSEDVKDIYSKVETSLENILTDLKYNDNELSKIGENLNKFKI